MSSSGTGHPRLRRAVATLLLVLTVAVVLLGVPMLMTPRPVREERPTSSQSQEYEQPGLRP